MSGAPSPLPSVRGRLARALLAWSVVWAFAVAAGVWLAVRHEVHELLDDTLQASSEILAALLVDAGRHGPQASGVTAPSLPADGARFAWQVVGPRGELLQQSPHAPEAALRSAPAPGFSRTPSWRIYGKHLDADGRMLYVAQRAEERLESEVEVALSAALAAAAVGLLGHWWLRRRLRAELAPLQRLAARLADHEPLDAGATMGPAEREELQPVHGAIDELALRLARRVAHERAFAAHAAHALRTPLAGIDAQLAIALREAPPAVAPRLQRVREAAGRLQRVVGALLALFRSGTTVRRQPVDLRALLALLPVHGLAVEVRSRDAVEADPDLLAAALLNLLDNALRCGARQVVVDVPEAGAVRLHDDGPGVSPARRAELQAAVDQQSYEGQTGLGLMLADLVARSHGGTLVLPAVERGFAAELRLS